MKRKTRNLIIVLTILILWISTLFMSFSFVSKKYNQDYEYVQKDIITNMDTRIVDIAVLGAHDALSAGITTKSKPNIHEGGTANNKIINLLAKGLVVRMTKTQTATAKELLYAGVRYLDIRLTKIDGIYYAVHGYLSFKFEDSLREIVNFLETHPGEFIIFDVQNLYTADGAGFELSSDDYNELLGFMKTVNGDKGTNILDYIFYDVSSNDINTLTYGQITNNKTTAGVVMLAKTYSSDIFYTRDKDASYKESREYMSIRSYWHETNSLKKLKEGINYEYNFIKEHDYNDILRVNQAQRTGFIMNASLLKSMISWSVIDMAVKTNKELIKDKDEFMKWLEKMPIFMVDEVTSNRGNFNKLANEYIMEYNKKY